MKQYHLRHHFISEKEWFGVSNPSLDLVFGTFRDPKTVAKERDDAQAPFLTLTGLVHVSCTSLAASARIGRTGSR